MSRASWYVDTITVKSVTGKGTHGDPSFGSNTEVKARVEYGVKLIRDRYNNEQQSIAKIATDTEILWDDRIWLPDQTPATDDPYRPIDIKSAANKAGVSKLYEVYL
jgi:hypothetical protein